MSSIHRFTGLAVATLLSSLSCPSSLHAQESPAASLASLRPADGVSVSLWASEPMLKNPTAMEIDSRGRVWIAEGMNYRMKQKQFDTLKPIEGADRIKVLTDSDGDGMADQMTVFAEDIFPVPLGMAVEEIWEDGKQTGTRVYVGNSPDLLVLEDLDGDDRAENRYALLTGFRGIDSDHGLHGMTFGPDGKMYFTVGDARYGADRVQAREATFQVVDRSGNEVTANNFGTTLRCNRDGSQLEVLSFGHRNNYETALDSFGNIFGSDNDDDGNRGCRMYWVMEGGQYGYNHPKSSRHWAEEVPGVIPKLVGTGNGSPAGIVVYEGQQLPAPFHGAVLQIDAGTHQVNSHPLQRNGAGFRSDYQVLLNGDDAWFRPVDLAVAPDGSVFVCDWYDAGVGGNRFTDQTTGRIYRLAGTDRSPNNVRFDGSNALESLASPNLPTRLAARDHLVKQGPAARTALRKLFAGNDAVMRARALYLLHSLPETGMQDTLVALEDADPKIREITVRLLPDEIVVRMAKDEDPGVRRELLLKLSDSQTPEAIGAIRTMASVWDGRDRYYLEALRAALVQREPDLISDLFAELTTWAIEQGWDNETIALPPYYPVGSNDAFLRIDEELPPSNPASPVVGLAWSLQRSECLPSLQRLLDQNHSPSVEQAAMIALCEIDDLQAGHMLINRFSSDAVDADSKREILRRIGLRVSGAWKALHADPSLHAMFDSALDQPELRTDAVNAIAHANLTEFGDSLIELIESETYADSERAAAIVALGRLQHPATNLLAARLLEATRRQPSGGPLAQAALNSIPSTAGGPGETGNAAIESVMLDVAYPLDVRRRAMQLASAQTKGAKHVLALQQANKLPEDLQDELVFLLHNHADRQIRRLAADQLPMRSGGDKQTIHVAADVFARQGNAERGRELFLKQKDAACARCHHVTGEGTLVGPDLASIGRKYGDKELLYHIQFPSGAINYNFVSESFLLADGRVLSGLVIDRADGKIKLGLATGEFVTIDVEDVEESQPQTVSLMPQGLIAGFNTQQVADLIEYLLTLRQGDAVLSKAP